MKVAGGPAGAPATIDYAAEVHDLLLRAIRDLSARVSPPPHTAFTSRELVSHLPLDDGARAAFADLVLTVERNLFGGAALGPSDLERSLEDFRLSTRPAPA